MRNIALVLVFLMPVAALGTRFDLWPYTIGMLLLAISVLGSLLIQIINAVWLLRKPSTEIKTTLRWASLFALPPLIIIATVMHSDGSTAGIHHISTDLDNPPEFVAAIKQRGEQSNSLVYSSDIANIQRQYFPDIAPIHTQHTPQDAYELALNTAQEMGWEIYASNPQQGRIEAMDSTFWFGFKDDIVIRVSSTENGARIDLRSVSRVGRGDMGANARRIAEFTKKFHRAAGAYTAHGGTPEIVE
jgi:uncharacterized protein (DUF1499 family)